MNEQIFKHDDFQIISISTVSMTYNKTQIVETTVKLRFENAMSLIFVIVNVA